MSTTVSAKMTAIANEIRTLSDTASPLGLDAMAERVGEANEEVASQEDLIADIIAALEGKSVESDEPILQAKTATASTERVVVVTPDTGYDGLAQVTIDAIPTAKQAIPSISVTSDGLITARATQYEGYVTAGTKSMTQQLTTQAAQTITPGTSDKTIAPGRYLTGTQTIKGDANLVAENIAEGVSIFGVLGTLASSGSLPDGVSALASGTFTLAEDASDSGISIEHGLGVTPNFAVAILGEDVSTAENVSNTMLYNIILTKTFFDTYGGQVLPGCFMYGYFEEEWGLTSGSQLNISGLVDDRWISFTAPIIKAGHTYHWICGVLDGIN